MNDYNSNGNQHQPDNQDLSGAQSQPGYQPPPSNPYPPGYQPPPNNQYPPGYQPQPGNQYPPNYQQAPNYHQSQNYQQPPNQPYPQQYPHSNSTTPPGKGKAQVSLALGIVAICLPIPFLDLIAGIIGLVFASMAKKEGFSGGLRTAGFVLSIVGTIYAFFYTLFWVIFGAWYLEILRALFHYF